MPDDGYYAHGPLTSGFLVKIDGQEIGHFTEVSGLELSIDVEEIEEGGNNEFVYKVPGRMSWPNITLKRGITQTDNLLAWMQKSSGDGFSGAGDKVTRSTMGITMLSQSGSALREWSVEGALPVKWTGPSFASTDDDAPTEELEIVHHGFTAKNL